MVKLPFSDPGTISNTTFLNLEKKYIENKMLKIQKHLELILKYV